MNRDEYNLLFHKLELNRVAFKRLMDCDEEVLKLVNAAIEQERKQEFVCSTGLCYYKPKDSVIVSEECAERGCACHDPRVDGPGVRVYMQEKA